MKRTEDLNSVINDRVSYLNASWLQDRLVPNVVTKLSDVVENNDPE